MLANSYIHNLDPFAIQITDSFGLRWYGLAYISGFLLAWVAIKWLGSKKCIQIPPNRVGDFMFACVIGVLVGGRLGYCLFYDPQMFITFTQDFPWWKVLAIQDGGMASHGGILGVFFAMIVWGKKNNISIAHLFDIGALFATPGLFFGRIANFINGELWGKSISQEQQASPPWWSVKYPTEITEVWTTNPDFYTQQLGALEPLQTSILGGTSFYNSVVIEAYAGNQEVLETIRPLLTAWYPSQLLQALAEGPILFFALLAIWWKPRKPGVIAGWFLFVYGVLRVATEVFRQPDEGVALLFGLSRGQVLSVVIIMCGVVLVWKSTARSAKKTGGFSTVFT